MLVQAFNCSILRSCLTGSPGRVSRSGREQGSAQAGAAEAGAGQQQQQTLSLF